MVKRTVAFLAALALAGGAHAQTTFRVVNHSDLKILDPVWTTAYIVRNHGYMVYDTLFAMDGNLEVKPQDIDPDAPLYGEGLGLDSIDILEVALIVSKQYGIHLRADSQENQQIFRSLRHLAEYIAAQRTK